MLKLCLTVILLGCVTQINCENLPVFIWGQKTPSFLPALSQLSGDEFVTLVKSQTDKETLTVVFVESSLSVEDFSQCKLKSKTCFENLRKVQQKTYLTAVDDPVSALEASYGKQKQKSISMSNDGDLSGKVDAAGSERLLFVYLDEIESQADFAKHDELMSKLYSSIASKHENVIAIYTARHPSFVYSKPLIRKARDTSEKAEAKPQVGKSEGAEGVQAKPQVVKSGKAEGDEEVEDMPQLVKTNPHFLLALSGLRIGADVITVDTIVMTVNETTQVPLTNLEVNLNSVDHNLGMQIELSGGTWSVLRFTHNDRRFFPESTVSAYDGKSYGCVHLKLSDARTEIVFTNIQIQPAFAAPAEGETFNKFSDTANDCIGFFSPAIWGALFVVIILVLILTCGITMMLDIRTMDRFDDPKGKTITINAQE